MTAITITVTGSNITGLTSNPSKTYTISDPDLQLVLNWAFSSFFPYINATFGSSPTNAQILLAWLENSLIAPTVNGIQVFNTPAGKAPPKIGLQ